MLVVLRFDRGSEYEILDNKEKFVKSMPQNKEKPNHPPRVPMTAYKQPIGEGFESKEQVDDSGSRAVAVPGQFSTDLLALDEKVKSMMIKSQIMIQFTSNGKSRNKESAMICKVCQKEGRPTDIRDHYSYMFWDLLPLLSVDNYL